MPKNLTLENHSLTNLMISSSFERVGRITYTNHYYRQRLVNKTCGQMLIDHIMARRAHVLKASKRSEFHRSIDE